MVGSELAGAEESDISRRGWMMDDDGKPDDVDV